eukprot:3049839-Heterocapsa_arctica.AAC.1
MKDPYPCLSKGPEGLTSELVEWMEERLITQSTGTERGELSRPQEEARFGPMRLDAPPVSSQP